MSNKTPYPKLEGDFLKAVRVVLDEEKIIRENIYDLEKVKNRIRTIYNVRNCETYDAENLIFVNKKGMELKYVISSFGSVTNYLCHCKWFIYNVKDWDSFYNAKEDGLYGWEDIYEPVISVGFLKAIEDRNGFKEE